MRPMMHILAQKEASEGYLRTAALQILTATLIIRWHIALVCILRWFALSYNTLTALILSL